MNQKQFLMELVCAIRNGYAVNSQVDKIEELADEMKHLDIHLREADMKQTKEGKLLKQFSELLFEAAHIQ